MANILVMTLDEYLTQNDLTETAFAGLVGCSQGTINKLRNGKTNPTMAMLQAISRATNGTVTPNDFLPDQEPAPSRPFRGDEAEGLSDEARGASGPQGAGETAFVEGAVSAEAGSNADAVASEAVRAAE